MKVKPSRLLGVALITLALAACNKHDEHAAHNIPVDATQAAMGIPSQQLEGLLVENAWARATVANQDATGAFFSLTASEPLTLVGASSPQAEIVEIHETQMDGDIMRMRQVTEVGLVPNQAVEFKPGGLHVMMMALNGQVNDGDELEISLLVQAADGSRKELPVRALAQSPGAAKKGGHHGH